MGDGKPGSGSRGFLLVIRQVYTVGLAARYVEQLSRPAVGTRIRLTGVDCVVHFGGPFKHAAQSTEYVRS